MTAETPADSAVLVARLTEALLAVDGVRELFPARRIDEVLGLVDAHRREPRELVRVEAHGTGLRVLVRLGTARAVPSPVVAERALAAMQDLLGPGAVVEIELAYIE